MKKLYQVAQTSGNEIIKGGIATDYETAKAWAEENNRIQYDSIRNGGDFAYFVIEADDDCITEEEYFKELEECFEDEQGR